MRQRVPPRVNECHTLQARVVRIALHTKHENKSDTLKGITILFQYTVGQGAAQAHRVRFPSVQPVKKICQSGERLILPVYHIIKRGQGIQGVSRRPRRLFRAVLRCCLRRQKKSLFLPELLRLPGRPADGAKPDALQSVGCADHVRNAASNPWASPLQLRSKLLRRLVQQKQRQMS